MQKRQTDLWSHHRWHLLASITFVAVIISVLAACGTNAGNQSGVTPAATAQMLANLTVYATSDTGILRALQANTGQLRWQGQTGTLAGGKPVIAHGIVYAGSENTVYAFNASGGTPLWSAQGHNPATGPMVADGKVFVDYITNNPDNSLTISVGALNGTDGSQLWRTQVGTQPVFAPGLFGQLVANGVFYVAIFSVEPTGAPLSHFMLYAYDINDGKLLWHTLDNTSVQGGVNATLVEENGIVFAYLDRLYAYKASDGALLWQSQGASQTLSGPGGTGNLLVKQGTVYVDTSESLTAYLANNGSQLWRVAIARPMDQFLEITLANGVVYASQPNGLTALDASTGKQLWRYKAGKQAQGFIAPLTDNDTVYISNFMSGLVALNIHTGTPRWQAPIGGNGNRPVLADGTLFVGSGEGVIAAVNAKDGTILWRFPTNAGMSFPSALSVAE